MRRSKPHALRCLQSGMSTGLLRHTPSKLRRDGFTVTLSVLRVTCGKPRSLSVTARRLRRKRGSSPNRRGFTWSPIAPRLQFVSARRRFALADELGLEEVRAGALVTVASALRPASGEQALHKLRDALEYADRVNAGTAAFRAINNLAVALRQGLDDIDGARQLAEEGLRRSERV